MRRSNKKKRINSAPFFIFAFLLLAAGIITRQTVFKSAQTYQSNNSLSAQIAGQTAHVLNSLQLKTINFTTPSPTPATPPPSAPQPTAPTAKNFCPHHTGLCYSKNSCDCNGGVEWTCHFTQCVSEYGVNNGEHYDCNSAAENVCTACAGVADGKVCLGKPVILLYPTTDTLVNVDVATSGKIVVSDPSYPDGGWKNVLAKPSGELTYKEQAYHELFYESDVKNFGQPDNGIIIPSSNLYPEIKKLIFQLGLNESESAEFLDFWIPKLENLNSNYILFSIVPQNIKNTVDNVTVEPAPDTRIEFIAYFKPLAFPIAIDPLKLPNRPQRIGFTEVEWGGTIDTNQTETILN